MPKLEPIVNQEPKDQLVPTFNKKEVAEVVNKGIQSGEIEIPSGGTKLYKHTITHAGPTIVIINLEDTSITKDNIMTKFYECISCYVKGVSPQRKMIYDAFEKTLYYVAYQGSMSPLSIDTSTMANVNDEVTPL